MQSLWRAAIKDYDKGSSRRQLQTTGQGERRVREGGELLFLPLDSSLLYCVAAKAGSCNGLWRCCLLSWDFFSTCCFDKPTGSLLVSPFAGGAKALCEAKLGWKAEDPGQLLNKGALAVLCKGRSCTVVMQETSFNDTRQQGLMLQVPAVLPQEEVQGGQGWAKSAGSRLVLLSPAEQVGTCVQSMQASTGSDSQGAAEIAHRALSYEGKRGACHDSALTSKALNLSCEFFNSSGSGGFNLTLTWRMAQLHLMPSQKGLLCLVFLVRANGSSYFHSSASDLWSFGSYRCTNVPIWTCCFLDILLVTSWASLSGRLC